MDDRAHMQAAIALARRGLGACWPNPSVGCVVVAHGRVVGRAVTAPGGRPHAEPQALAMAGDAARGATAYVTLEPCCHHGMTPPCTDALIAAGIVRVVVGVGDPDRRVAGGGVAALRAAGIVVKQGVRAAEAGQVTAGFLARAETGRPLVSLKLASTLDGRIATREGASRWITGPAARRDGHALRGRHDAIMVGASTALADDPDLTCRIEGFRTTAIVRVVVDTALRLPLTSRLVQTADTTPTWVIAGDDADPTRRQALATHGVLVLAVARGDGGLDMAAALAALGARGLTSVLVEGGGRLAASLLRAGLVDRLAWFHAPSIMGGDGLAAVAAMGVAALPDMARFERQRARLVGDDMLTEFCRAA